MIKAIAEMHILKFKLKFKKKPQKIPQQIIKILAVFQQNLFHVIS